MSCMRPINSDAAVCPHCLQSQTQQQLSPFLPLRTRLQGRYLVGKVLVVRCDCADYIGYDSIEEKTVLIHEFLPEKLIFRPTGEKLVTVKEGAQKIYSDCISSFEMLWKSLRVQALTALEKVEDVFFENNTAYAVVQYEKCVTLGKFISSRQTPFSWNMVCGVFKPILYALTSLHRASIVHGDISLNSILIRPDGRLMLTGFSIPQSHMANSPVFRTPSKGFSSIERCECYEMLTPTADVYSIAAVIYTCLSGLVVPDARTRAKEDRFTVSPQILNTVPEYGIEALMGALEVFPNTRLSGVTELLRCLVKVDVPQQTEEKQKELQPSVEQQEQETPQEEPVAQEAQEIYDDISEQKSESIFAVIAKTFIATVLVFSIVFLTAYVTFLYKKIHIEFLDNMLSAVSFLPMNKDNNKETVPAIQTQTTAGTVPAESESENTTSSEKVAVADFTKLNYETIIQNEVFKENYNLEFTFEYSETYEKNAIISQSIPEGQQVPMGTTISLVVSRGKPKVTLKDVVGMDYEQAKAILTTDGFVVIKKTAKNNGSHKDGEVCEMSLVAGLSFEKGTQITLTVWESQQNKAE